MQDPKYYVQQVSIVCDLIILGEKWDINYIKVEAREMGEEGKKKNK